MTEEEQRKQTAEWYQEKFNKFVLDDLTRIEQFSDRVVMWLFLYGVGILIILAGIMFLISKLPK